MSSLTGQQINQSYQGLLKLSDSSTGITQSLQSIQDGLGNDTGLRLSQDQLESPNIPSFVSLKPQYTGSGYAFVSPQQMAAGTQNIILATPFLDNGTFSYSALSYSVVTATTSSDTVEAAIYTSQLSNPYGLCPFEPIISGLTLDVSTTGVKTVTFPSNISMSGYGGGVYWIVFKVSNSGVQPTVRFGSNVANLAGSFQIYGMTQGVNGVYSASPRLNGNFAAYTGTTTFDNPFSVNLPTTQSTTATINGSTLGFILHTI